MYLYGKYPQIELNFSNGEPLLKILSDKPIKKAFFEPFEGSRETVSISYENDIDNSTLYTHNSSKFIFSFHLNTEYEGSINLGKPLIANTYLLKDVELYHLKSLERLKEYHLARIRGIHNYAHRDITEQALLKYSALIKALTREKL